MINAVDRFIIKDVIRHSGVLRPGVNLAPENARKKKPRNVDYFTPDRETFEDPRDVASLMKHANEEGHIHRLPFWLHSDNLAVVAPHGLCYFRAGGLICRSLRDASGGINTAIRFTDGKHQLVDCDPAECPAHIKGECKFSGRLYFYALGQMSPNPMLLPTTSLNSFRLIISALNNILRVRGSIKGLHKGKPFMELIKVRKDVTRIDNGSMRRQPQWLISVSLTVPMDELLVDENETKGKTPPLVETTDIVADQGMASQTSNESNRDDPSVNASPGEIRRQIVNIVHEIGINPDEMKLWAETVAGSPVRTMDAPHLHKLLSLLQGAQKGENLQLIHEIELVKALNTIGISFESFKNWLVTDEHHGESWEEIVAHGKAADFVEAIKIRAKTDPTGFKAAVEKTPLA